ncbi:MAG TPA: hypothetical protein VFE58_18615 [Tepidisphaeraceae bacterium]|jgi:hypothetical protein|nr:hypothetical protein [Tepidisphaeraceae bacterium]
MPTTTQTQFSVFLMNKPGALAAVLSALAAGGSNLLAVTLVDSQEHGVLRIVAEDHAKARALLAPLNLPISETDVLCVQLDHRPGALASLASALGENHVNINYVYCTSPAAGDRAVAILKVADPAKAMKLLA